MPTEDVKLLGDKIDDLVTRVGTLEEAVTALMAKAASHDKVLRWLKTAGLILLGLGLGSGAVKLDDVIALLGTP
jgi:hypothetical protein